MHHEGHKIYRIPAGGAVLIFEWLKKRDRLRIWTKHRYSAYVSSVLQPYVRSETGHTPFGFNLAEMCGLDLLYFFFG